LETLRKRSLWVRRLSKRDEGEGEERKERSSRRATGKEDPEPERRRRRSAK
jgi:hypothetical protein